MPIKYKIDVIAELKAPGYNTKHYPKTKIIVRRHIAKLRQGKNTFLWMPFQNLQIAQLPTRRYNGICGGRRMKIIKYPSETDVNKAISDNEPLLVLISFDGKTVITSQIDEAVEHHILLMKTGF